MWLLVASSAAFFGFASSAHAQPTPPPVSEEASRLVERERVRVEVESVLRSLEDSGTWLEDRHAYFESTTRRLRGLGPGVSEFLIGELDRSSPLTFYTAAYVLGHVKTPASTEALRRALETADAEADNFARYRKQWTLYALAIQGEPDVVDLLDTGSHRVGGVEFMERMPLVELVAMLTLPQSVERLHAQLDRLSKQEGAEPTVANRLLALGRVADPASAPKILAFTRHPLWQVRATAVRALGLLGQPSLAGGLVEALEDPDENVRGEAAFALLDLKPTDKLPALLSRLEAETAPFVRASLYRAIAQLGGEGMVEALRSHWGRDDYIDRMGVMDALGDLSSPKGLNLCRAALRDSEIAVVFRSVAALDRIGGLGARDTLLALIGDSRWPVVQSVVETLAKRGEVRAAPRIADRLLRSVLNRPIRNPTRRTEVYKLGDALVALRYPDPAREILEAVPGQVDPEIVDYLKRLVKKLETLRQLESSVPKWTEALASPDADVRRLAYARLADLGTAAGGRALVETFGRAPADERVEILRELARMGSSEALPLVERILAEPEFDDREHARLRDMAAWAARRIGGDRLATALRRSAERRDGQDISVLTYLAVLEGPEAASTLRAFRVAHLRHFMWMRGAEQQRLDWILRQFSLGRRVPSLDKPPEEIAL